MKQLRSVADVIKHYRGGMNVEQRTLTAKVTFDIYYQKKSFQWTAGNAYTATWHKGWIEVTSDTDVYWFGGSEKEHVYENFIFWGSDHE